MRISNGSWLQIAVHPGQSTASAGQLDEETMVAPGS